MARVSIYISDELRAKMSAAGDQLNWSDIARPALERALYTHESNKDQIMSAIDRLRKSKDEYLTQLSKRGIANGRKWAAETATYRELRDLSTINLDHYNPNYSGIRHAMYQAVDRNETLPFEIWADNVFEVDDHDDEWGLHFARGAQAFFKEVEDQI